MIGIYKIENIKNKKVYIGKSRDIIRRWGQHIQHLENNCHHCARLQKDFNDFGIKNFSFQVIFICEHEDEYDLSKLEDYYINEYFLNGDVYNTQINYYNKKLNKKYVLENKNKLNAIYVPNNLNFTKLDSLLAQKIALYIINCYNKYNNKDFNISITEISNVFETKSQSIYRDINKYLNQIKTITINNINIFDNIEYKSGIICIKINSKIPKLTFNTFKIKISNMNNIKSSYTFKLLSLIKKDYIKINVNDILYKFNIFTSSYNKYSNIKLKILNPIIYDIKNTGYSLEFKEIKLGKKVNDICFKLN